MNYRTIDMKLTVLFILVLVIPAYGYCQQPDDSQQKIFKEKMAFFNQRLALTTKEADKFWPVYNDYQNRKNKTSIEKRALIRYYMQNEKNMLSAEITETLNKYIEYEKSEAELFIFYNEKFRNILPDEKVLKIYVTEVQFKDYLLRKLRTN